MVESAAAVSTDVRRWCSYRHLIYANCSRTADLDLNQRSWCRRCANPRNDQTAWLPPDLRHCWCGCDCWFDTARCGRRQTAHGEHAPLCRADSSGKAFAVTLRATNKSAFDALAKQSRSIESKNNQHRNLTSAQERIQLEQQKPC